MSLPRRGWTADGHAKLEAFLALHARDAGHGAFAVFDADNTVWAGDLGDSLLVHLLRELRLSARVADILPEVLEVPAGDASGSPAPGVFFPAARAREAIAAMQVAPRTASSIASSREPCPGFSSRLIEPGGPLHGDVRFRNAYRVFAGVVMATYNLLEAQVGCVAFDEADARDVTAWFPEDVRGYFRGDLRFASMLDTGPQQAALRRQGRLGSYSQIAVWEALDKTEEELRAIGVEAWARTPVDTRFEAPFPIDPAGATAPRPLDFGVASERLAVGGSAADGVTMGVTAMLEGTRARPEIAELFAAMTRLGVVPVVVTASQVDVVRAALDRHYGFAGNPVVGMRATQESGRYTADLLAPATYRSGKVEAIRQVARDITGDEGRLPALAAGDTNTDLEMLAYSGGWRLFFDRRKRPLMDLADHLVRHGSGARTLVEQPL
jgi:phosphoserine phosphatase